MVLKFGAKKWFVFVILILLLIDLTIFLNIIYLRQILGFLFLTLLPGVLILQILKLNKIYFLEKFILAWGLSISFLLFFGLLINNSVLALGYETPLATIPLLISFNFVFIVLAIMEYKINKGVVFSFPDLNIGTSEKAFLIVPILFPALSIFGMHIMNTTGNNVILMFLLFLIPIYVVFVCFFNQKFSKRLYPVVIFLISISLLLLLSLRSNHIIGIDVHLEYYFFQTTLNNMHWSVFEYSTLDACLSISLLPTIYQSILNIPSEFLFKILYSLLYSISPLVIYTISKKYVGETYAFLASCFFMFQFNFLWTEYNARTNTAILFFGLAMMMLFNDKIDPLKRRILFIVFMASCMVSHYSTTYIFFFIMLGAFIGMEIVSKKYTFKKVISLTIVILFFTSIFFWYSQVTEVAFSLGVRFIENTLSSLQEFFIKESKAGMVQSVCGVGITEKGIPHKIEFVWTWLTFAFIGIGLITSIIRYKEMSFPELNFKNPDFLKDKFEVGYFVIALICAGLLVAMVAVPHLAAGYNLDRLYAVAITILSVFFVVGGITLSKQTFRGGFTKSKSQIQTYLIILLVLFPYFLCVTGVMYNIFGVPRAITLNSEGEQYDMMYIHDREGCSAKWLVMYRGKKDQLYADFIGNRLLVSHGKIPHYRINYNWLSGHEDVDGYIYLRYQNVIKGKLYGYSGIYNMTEYSHIFAEKFKIYDTGGSDIWR